VQKEFIIVVPIEPINLKEWKLAAGFHPGGRLFTCGRPGRAVFGRKRVHVDDGTIDRWVDGLLRIGVGHIVSLLGCKNDGFSEFDYYPFRSSKEFEAKPTFQDWLDKRYGPRLVVHEFSTIDADPQGIPSDVLETVKHCVLDLVRSGNTVVVVDSYGSQRTSKVCEAAGFK
jgi:hypothetical protein